MFTNKNKSLNTTFETKILICRLWFGDGLQHFSKIQKTEDFKKCL